MKKRVWCQHFCWIGYLGCWKFLRRIRGDWFYDLNFNFCPICAAPRPVEKAKLRPFVKTLQSELEDKGFAKEYMKAAKADGDAKALALAKKDVDKAKMKGGQNG